MQTPRLPGDPARAKMPQPKMEVDQVLLQLGGIAIQITAFL